MNSMWAAIPLVIIGFVVTVLVLQWLWNSTLPDVFGFKKITLFQAFKILILSTILTGGGSKLFSNTSTETKSTNGSTTTITTSSQKNFSFP